MPALDSSGDPGALLGARFIHALVEGDFDAMRSMLHPAVKFRGLSPHKFLKVSPSDPVGGVIRAFRLWFYEGEGEYADHPEELLTCSVAPFGAGGRYKLSYRVRSKSREMAEFYREEGFGEVADDADWIVEQEAYYDVFDGTIAWMIVLCGGYQPLEPIAIASDIPESASRQIVV